MATLHSKKEIEIIDKVFAFWQRIFVSDAVLSYDDLLNVVYRYYMITEVMVDLVLYKFRDPWRYRQLDMYHPSNLLDGRKDTFYLCKHSHPAEDWIIFKQKEERKFAPIKIMIRNSVGPAAVKYIAISWSDDDVPAETMDYWDLCEKYTGLAGFDIKNGEKEVIDEEQWFELDLDEIRFLKFMKLDIWENYGSKKNAFHEFVVFGVLE